MGKLSSENKQPLTADERHIRACANPQVDCPVCAFESLTNTLMAQKQDVLDCILALGFIKVPKRNERESTSYCDINYSALNAPLGLGGDKTEIIALVSFLDQLWPWNVSPRGSVPIVCLNSTHKHVGFCLKHRSKQPGALKQTKVFRTEEAQSLNEEQEPPALDCYSCERERLDKQQAEIKTNVLAWLRKHAEHKIEECRLRTSGYSATQEPGRARTLQLVGHIRAIADALEQHWDDLQKFTASLQKSQEQFERQCLERMDRRSAPADASSTMYSGLGSNVTFDHLIRSLVLFR